MQVMCWWLLCVILLRGDYFILHHVLLCKFWRAVKRTREVAR